MSENGFEARTKRSVQRNTRITHLNIRSIKNREHFILTKELVMKNDSESWLDNTVQDLEVEIPTYNIYRLDRLNKSGGGVCAFVKNCFKVECLNE